MKVGLSIYRMDQRTVKVGLSIERMNGLWVASDSDGYNTRV